MRYTQIEQELADRYISEEDFAQGSVRFVIGLAKKVLLANVLGEFTQEIAGMTGESVILAWLYAATAAMQIYYDFSGYSDMAIGLGRMFGFHFPENFRYPFIAESATVFWRRWHITLGSWFRDYVYIPLGGNRAGKSQMALKYYDSLVSDWAVAWSGLELYHLGCRFWNPADSGEIHSHYST